MYLIIYPFLVSGVFYLKRGGGGILWWWPQHWHLKRERACGVGTLIIHHLHTRRRGRIISRGRGGRTRTIISGRGGIISRRRIRRNEEELVEEEEEEEELVEE